MKSGLGWPWGGHGSPLLALRLSYLMAIQVPLRAQRWGWWCIIPFFSFGMWERMVSGRMPQQARDVRSWPGRPGIPESRARLEWGRGGHVGYRAWGSPRQGAGFFPWGHSGTMHLPVERVSPRRPGCWRNTQIVLNGRHRLFGRVWLITPYAFTASFLKMQNNPSLKKAPSESQVLKAKVQKHKANWFTVSQTL